MYEYEVTVKVTSGSDNARDIAFRVSEAVGAVGLAPTNVKVTPIPSDSDDGWPWRGNYLPHT